MAFVPESPAFHVKKGRREEAFRALKMYRGTNARDKDVRDELNEVLRSKVVVYTKYILT
jgi:hypothetical protein